MKRGTFYLDKRQGKVMGVCAGLARMTGWDVTLIRVALVVVTIAGAFPWTPIAYLVAGLVAKKRSDGLAETAEAPARRMSAAELNGAMRDIDRRLAEVDTFVAAPNSSLAREIEALR
ncbi:MAG: PspC domain-containing protein [Alphaproteobacteria bacterium]|nr:PspC domain-containing protein [Alphaproteobacteria bacterium]MBV9372892.1 PspC domain-containing protein [Alphaproteobacteria bacterium]MBV9902080.1 PspC domain-containing protein [Alphaproteobacteria bacterium]